MQIEQAQWFAWHIIGIMRDWLRILFVGDEEVGKSSIISTFISKQFPLEVPDIMFDAKLPPECSSNNTGLILVDSSQDLNQIRQKIALSDCIVCVFDATRLDTLSSLSNKWLPLIKECDDERNCCSCVTIACNKDDLLEEDKKRGVHAIQNQTISHLMHKYSCVKDSVVTSPKTDLSSLEHLMYATESMIVFPKDYLFDPYQTSCKNFEFTPTCTRALTRIFRWFDVDYDGLLSNTELQQLDMYCFNIQTSLKDIENIKNATARKVPGGVKDNKVTITGFFDMMKRMLVSVPGGGGGEESSKSSRASSSEYGVITATSTCASSIWTILRACGYDDMGTPPSNRRNQPLELVLEVRYKVICVM